MNRTRKLRTDTAPKPGIYQRAKGGTNSNSSGGNDSKNTTKKGDHHSGSMAKPDPVLAKNSVSSSTAASAAAFGEESTNSNTPATARYQELSQALGETDSPRARQKLKEAKELDKKLDGNRVCLD